MIRLLVMAWPRSVARAEYLERTLTAIDRYIAFGDLAVDRVVSSESADCDPEAVRRQAASCVAHGYRLAWRASPTPSVGGHVNEAMAAPPAWDWVYYNQEDHEPTAPIDAARAIAFLQAHPEFLLARFYVTGLTAPPTPIAHWPGWYELLPDMAPYFWCHAPYLARPLMIDRLGPFAQVRSEPVANRRAKDLARAGRCRIAVFQPNHYRHIGLDSTMPEKWAANARAKAARLQAGKGCR